jgi:hypothetical protein
MRAAPPKTPIDRFRSRSVPAVPIYAVVSDQTEKAVEVFVRREQAERFPRAFVPTIPS